MKSHEEKKSHGAHRHHKNEPMSLDDIRMRLVVNQMKIRIEHQRLVQAVMPGSTPLECALENNVSRFETIMQYATFAITVYRMVRRATDIVRALRGPSATADQKTK